MKSKQFRHIKTRISPDLLDTIGKSFKFKHGKGIAEWLKNALDQYLRLHEQGEEPLTGAWPVVIHLIDGNGKSSGPNLAVIDFGGTTYKAIEQFFLYWGDTTAASHGGSVAKAALTGGHGNGGKFYMREMWRDGARFLTWKKGKVTSLVVKRMADKSTGYFEFEDEDMEWKHGLAFALSENENLGGAQAIVDYLEAHNPRICSNIEKSERGFTAVVGMRAVQTKSANDIVVSGKWRHQQLIDEIREAQQARRPIRELSIAVIVNGDLQIEKLTLQSIEDDPEWQLQKVDLFADQLSLPSKDESNGKIGTLTIHKSANQLTGRFRDSNALFITDSNGNPIAFYPITELPLPGYSSLLSFINAELQLGFDGLSDLVMNDRERLVDSSNTISILTWVADKIWQRVKEIEKANQENKQKQNLEIASILNNSLNKHAQKFMKQIQTDIMVDFVSNDQGGGPGNGGSGLGGTTKGVGGSGVREKGKGGKTGTGGDLETPGFTKRIKVPEFPRILLSGLDLDPSKDNGETKYLTDRHPPLHQDDVDRQYNVWWLNTTHPYAASTLTRGGPKGHAFKAHHLSMFRDMVQREALRILQRREAELPLDLIENELDDISNRFLAELPVDIVNSLLE